MTVATDDPAAHSPTLPEPAAPARTRSVLPWAVAMVAVAVALFSTVQWLGLQGEADDRRDVALASTAFLADLLNWDAGDGMDDTVTALRAQGTGRFLAQAEDLFGGPLGDELEVAAATSEGAVEDLFVQSIEGDRAEVFAIVQQSVSSTVTSGSERTIRQVILQLERVEGTWRIENLELPELVRQAGSVDEEG